MEFRSRGLSSWPLRVDVLCSRANHHIFSWPLSSKDYKWVPANWHKNLTKCEGLQWTIIPSRGVDRHTTYHFVLQTSGINLSSHRLLYLHHLFLSLFSVSIFSKMEIMISIELKEACMRCKVRALLRAFAVTYVRSSIRLFKSVIYH